MHHEWFGFFSFVVDIIVKIVVVGGAVKRDRR